MSAVMFSGSGPALSEADLASFEKRLGVRLPEDYRSFLLSTNGGQPRPAFIFINDLNESVLIGVLPGIGMRNDLNAWLTELEGDIPTDLVPIAFDRGGNAFLMKVGDETSTKVYYWDSARHFPQSSDSENAFEVANSFSDFLKLLAPG